MNAAIRWLVPRTLRSGGSVRSAWQLAGHLLHDYGWWRSFREQKVIDRDGRPIPWFTYPAIDFLSQLDLSSREVFEYGAGASTLFWAGRAARVISVESDPAWCDVIRRQLPKTGEVILSPVAPDEYAGQITRFGQFDVIVVDGTGESRLTCCRLAPAHLKPGGMVVLDNSDLWLESARTLREAGLIQADFTGFAPLMPHAQTTSVFFSRQYDMQPLLGRQPQKSVAQVQEPWPGA